MAKAGFYLGAIITGFIISPWLGIALFVIFAYVDYYLFGSR